MLDEVNSVAAKAVANLDSDEMREYQMALAVLEEQMGIVGQVEAALEKARFTAQALDERRIRTWRKICRTHNLDPNVNYSIDGAGQVYLPAETGPVTSGE